MGSYKLRFDDAKRVLSATFMLLAINVAGLACECKNPSVCESYTRAVAVFTGKLVSIEKDNSTFIPTAQARFQVVEAYKGVLSKFESVRVRLSDCFDTHLTIGEEYFVYEDADESRGRVCNRTVEIGQAEGDLEFARSLSTDNPVFLITGVVVGIPKSDFSRTTVALVNDKYAKTQRPDSDGFFEFHVNKPGRWTVRIHLPYNATTFVKGIDGENKYESRRVEYAVGFLPNGCNRKEIEVNRKDFTK